MPETIIENHKTSVTIAGTAVALLLNAGTLADCVSDGRYEMQKYFDNLELPELVGVASAASEGGAEIPEDWCDATQGFHSGHGDKIMRICDGFDEIDNSMNEPIKIPDEITKMLEDNSRDTGNYYYVCGERYSGKSFGMTAERPYVAPTFVSKISPSVGSHLFINCRCAFSEINLISSNEILFFLTFLTLRNGFPSEI